jgi:NADPH:quinone reductase-like Zn-dependent oxidoreductase
VDEEATMKAIAHDVYGSPDVLELREVDEPVAEDGKVVIRVRAASVQAGDWHIMRGLPYVVRLMGFGLRSPKEKIRGADVAGHVESVGAGATRLQPGDEVFGSCSGAFAEYVSAPEDSFVQKPAGVTFAQAAAVPSSALTALQGLRDHGRVREGQHVLVNGASGGVGTFAVQIARALGAEVTGVCSTRNVDLVRSIGADDVVDYTREDFTRRGVRYDVILDIAVGHSLSACRRALTDDGTYVLIGDAGGRWIGGLGRFGRALALSPFVRQHLRAFVAAPSHDDLVVMAELLEAGKVTPVIDREYPLHDVPAAIRYVEEGHARGKVVIIV